MSKKSNAKLQTITGMGVCLFGMFMIIGCILGRETVGLFTGIIVALIGAIDYADGEKKLDEEKQNIMEFPIENANKL